MSGEVVLREAPRREARTILGLLTEQMDGVESGGNRRRRMLKERFGFMGRVWSLGLTLSDLTTRAATTANGSGSRSGLWNESRRRPWRRNDGSEGRRRRRHSLSHFTPTFPLTHRDPLFPHLDPRRPHPHPPPLRPPPPPPLTLATVPSFPPPPARATATSPRLPPPLSATPSLLREPPRPTPSHLRAPPPATPTSTRAPVTHPSLLRAPPLATPSLLRAPPASHPHLHASPCDPPPPPASHPSSSSQSHPHTQHRQVPSRRLRQAQDLPIGGGEHSGPAGERLFDC
ncbi:hypothetical protein Fmac_010022 [Flemingia macrophylla]|uniref:Uncharacterized protein n=1 Tax=Flemingia macrophylla TaxID=520843 RepID=A0ABD1N1X2_9FABA